MKDKKRPVILVTNDDSIHAKGVHELIQRLVKYGEVYCVCPETPKSGGSMALTVYDPLKLKRYPDYHGAKMFSITGTPVDCVKLSVHNLLPHTPDLIVSGINHGSNAAVNVLYSGTMGAAMEGAVLNIPSVGFSLTDHDADADFSRCYRIVDLLIPAMLERGLPDQVCLNVNVPHQGEAPTEARATVSCRGKWNDNYQKYTDPSGGVFYWLSGHYVNEEPENTNTDEWCLAHGIVSVVPITVDRSTPTAPDVDWLAGVLAAY